MTKHNYPTTRAKVTFAVDEELKITKEALEKILNSPDSILPTARAEDKKIAKEALDKIK